LELSASFDGCGQVLQREFPDVLFLQSPKNLGFAGANNLEVEKSSGSILFFLNPDTKVIGPTISVMVSHLQGLPDAGAIGCKLLNSDFTLQTDCVQPFPTIMNQMLDIDILKALFPKLSFAGLKPLFGEVGIPQVAEVICGATLMVRRDVFKQINGFSIDYFIYGEDVDLCYKIRSTGWKTYYVCDVAIIHHSGGSTKAVRYSQFSSVMTKEAVFKFFKKTRGPWYSTFYRLSVATVAVIRFAIVVLCFPLRKITLDNRRLTGIALKWRGILLWTLCRETSLRRISATHERL
jgi:GT2 family glycosyltransferase